jgi:hypothetical protein
VGVVAAEGLEPARAEEVVVEGDGDGSGHVVVAGARGAEGVGSAGGELTAGRAAGIKLAAGAAGEDTEALKGASDAGRAERVVAMAALDLNFDEVFRSEAAEVDAGSGG